MSCGKPHEVDCDKVLGELFSYLDSEATELDGQTIREHLEECAPCMSKHDLEAAVQAVVRRSCVCEPAPESLRLRIRAQITQITVTQISEFRAVEG